jgi:hypothetical protein
MSENRLTDYVDHMQQAATDACGVWEGWPRMTSLRTNALSRRSS